LVSSSTGGVTQDDLDLKQDILSRNSHVNISSLIVSDDAFSINTIVPGQISCNSLLIGGVDIDTQIDTQIENASDSGTSVVFIASRAGTHLVGYNAIVPFNIEVLNTGGGYSGLNYKFTAPIAGAYHFNMSIDRVAGKIGQVDMRYITGSTDVIKQTISIANDNPSNYFMDLTIYCNIGDRVYCKTNGSSSSTQMQINASTYFSGFLIR